MSNNTDKKIDYTHQELLAALDVLKEPIFLHDKECRILSCNRAYQQCAGLPFNQIIGRPYYEIFPKTHIPLRHCLRFSEQAEAEEGEEELQVGERLLRSHVCSVKDEKGGYLYSVHTLEDITETRLGQQALRKSEKRYRRLFEAVQEGILLVDGETWMITDANPFILDMLSLSINECAGKKLWEIGFFPDTEAEKAAFRDLSAQGQSRLKELPLKTKTGRLLTVELVCQLFDLDGRKIIQCNIRDITNLKLTEQIVQDEKVFSETLVQSLPDIFFLLDRNGVLLQWNKRLEALLGLTREEMQGAHVLTFIHEEDRQLFAQQFQEAFKTGSASTEARLILRNGLRYYTLSGKRIKTRHGVNVVGIGIDITDRRQAEEHLKLFRALLDHSGDAIEVIDPWTTRFLDVNETECRTLGYSREELLSMNVYDIDPAFNESLSKTMEGSMLQSEGISFERFHRRKDGSTFPVEIRATLIQLDKPYIVSMARDIRERKNAEEKLRSSEEKYRLLFESSRDALVIIEPSSWKFTDVNNAAMKLFGADRVEEFTALGPLDVSPPRQPDGRSSEEKIQEMLTTAMREGSHSFEWEHQRFDGSPFAADVLLTRMELGGKVTLQATVRDITERKESEVALKRAVRALRTLSASNLAIVRAGSEDELLQNVTNAIVQKGGYSLAVVCCAQKDTQKSIAPVAWSGSGTEESVHLKDNPCWGSTEKDCLPVSLALRTGTTQICRTIADESVCKDWRDAALSRGYISHIAIPLFRDSAIFGALSIYSSGAELFDEEEIKLLEELASDLAYGITTMRTSIAHEQQAIVLRQSLEQSIMTIAATLEARDPYTAGHQRRVGELATAIAHEMDLPEEQVQGVHFAALIHDLGKIHVPAEILSKPGRLSEIELKLIQIHPQAGYEILKDVNFPWPIAEIIRQHHERLDGSGYPQRLKENQILTESMIIAVADVVEAMASHRPYRPARGIGPALDEIRRGRSSQYDPAVVDACLKLFTEKKFTFSSTDS